MKRLKVKFTYECEICIADEKLGSLSENLTSRKVIDGLTDNINGIFLIKNGRFGTGGIIDYNFEVKLWKD